MYLFIVKDILDYPQVEYVSDAIVLANSNLECFDLIIDHEDYCGYFNYDEDIHYNKDEITILREKLMKKVEKCKTLKIDNYETVAPDVILSNKY